MSEKDKGVSQLDQIFEKYAALHLQQSQETNKRLDKLAGSVDKLTESHIRTEERHEQYEDRFERIEINQKEQGKKIDTVSNTLLLLEKDVDHNKKPMQIIEKIILAVVTAAVIYLVMQPIKGEEITKVEVTDGNKNQ